MRDNEYYRYELDYDTDEKYEEASDDSEYTRKSESQSYGNEMARNAVERFLEAEAGDYIADYDRKQPEPEEVPVTEYEEDPWQPAPSPAHEPEPSKSYDAPSKSYDNEEEYLAALASARNDRQRRRDQNPTPKPAVKVNAERRRRTPPPTQPEGDIDDAPLDEEGFSAFRQRYSHEVVSPPKEARMKEPRTHGAAPPRRKEPQPQADGPNPMRYLVAFIVVGVLGIMAVMTFNNRNLRRELDEIQGQEATIEAQAVTIQSLELDIDGYRAQVAGLTAERDGYRAQVQAQAPQDGQGDPAAANGAAGAPTGETTVDDGAGAEDTTPPADTGPRTHVVQRGDSLSRIARIYFGSDSLTYQNLILAANPQITDPDDIRIGQEINIPPRE